MKLVAGKIRLLPLMVGAACLLAAIIPAGIVVYAMLVTRNPSAIFAKAGLGGIVGIPVSFACGVFCLRIGLRRSSEDINFLQPE
jgi:hypothetical protein